MDNWHYLLVYMGIGLLIFEWAWMKTAPLRVPNEERDSKYPAFRRTDKQWRKWRYYPGALTLIPMKILLIVSVFFFGIVFLKIAALGHDLKGGHNPLIGKRQRFVQLVFKVVTPLLSFFFGYKSYL